MNTIRVLLNGVLTFFCFSGGAYLLERGSFFLRDRWNPETGTYFSGMPLYLLAFGLFFLGAFAAAVALAWMRGTIPMPDPGNISSHPVYKGLVILRYWYFVVPALVLVISAFMLAKHAPDPSLHPMPQRGAASSEWKGPRSSRVSIQYRVAYQLRKVNGERPKGHKSLFLPGEAGLARRV